jgi:hypothetical protein
MGKKMKDNKRVKEANRTPTLVLLATAQDYFPQTFV